MKDGVKIEKGVTLNESYLLENFEHIGDLCQFFCAYPDLYIDLITPEDDNINLFFYQRIFLRSVMRFKTIYVTACLRAGTPVLTQYGMVPIEKVNPNWKIWTKDGWSKVENLNAHTWNGKPVRIKAQNCLEDEITVTDDHRFYCIPREKVSSRPGTFWKDGLSYFNVKDYEARKEHYRIALRQVEPQWIEAKDLKPNDWLLSYIDVVEEDIDSINAPPIPNAHCVNIIKPIIKLDNLFYEWLGIWLAEGSWNQANSSISFTINEKEDRLAKRIQYLTSEIFGLNTPSIQHRNNNSQVIAYTSKHLCVFFEELFKTTADQINQYNKYIPPIILHGTPTKQLQLVKGWLDGDGYYRSAYGRDYKGTTVSSLLCEGIKMCLYRNYINPSISTETREGKAKVYNIVFGGACAEEFENAINDGRDVLITNEMRLSDYYPVKIGAKLFMRNRISEVTVLPETVEDVWCLQMPNETFNVDGVEGHNCRAWSKSFLTILGLMLQCIFIPNHKAFICAPNKSQGAQIAKEKIYEIYRHWPLIRKEVVGGDISDTPGNFGKDYVSIKFRNGSIFDVVGALDSSLGGRRHSGLIDEIKNHDEEAINTIVLPLLNVSRRLPNNTVNPKEPNQQVICATSAWQKTSFAYERLIDNFEKAIIEPDKAFVFGCDYRVPVLHGLLDRDYINDLKMSPSYNETTFATEYLSIWQGASQDSWFNFDRLSKHRKVKNPEERPKYTNEVKEQFYLLSWDVARLHDQSVVCIFRVNVHDGTTFHATLVNIKMLGLTEEERTFQKQVIAVKKLIKIFNPREVVIDTNGLGIGVADLMIQEQVDEFGTCYPAYGFNNDDDYSKIQPKEAPKILYGLKANSTLKSKIHSNVYSRTAGGLVHFLIKEQEAKNALLATKAGQKMSTVERVKRLMPHELTSNLFDQMANLRLKQTSVSGDVVLEQINARFPDDKYMAFAYGLWRIKELEEQYSTRKRRRGNGNRRYLFFT